MSICPSAMPKRSIDGFDPTGLNLDKPFYSVEDFDRIVEAVGRLPNTDVEHRRLNDDGSDFVTVSVSRKEALAERLETAANWWHVNSQYQTEPTSKQSADAFGKIEKAAKDLLGALGLPVKPVFKDETADMPQALRYGGLQPYAAKEKWLVTGDGRLREAVRGVYQIRNRARRTRKLNTAKPETPRESRHAGDAALDELFVSLANIYRDIFERRIATSVGSPTSAKEGQAIGPLVRFLCACLTPLLKDDTPTPEAIRERCRRLFKGRHKPDSN